MSIVNGPETLNAHRLHSSWKTFAMGMAISAALVQSPRAAEGTAPDVGYQNYRQARGPWSIHVVRVPRRPARFDLHAVHAGNRAIGLSPLSQQIRSIAPAWGTPVAGINGDFYKRDGTYAGDPRGLQIVDGELISAPTGGAAFWLDAVGDPHTTNVQSLFTVTWPDGKTTRVGLNAVRQANGAELYTAAMGASTRTSGGREFILEKVESTAWLPLRPGKTYRAKVREVRDEGNSRVTLDTLVLSLGPSLARTRGGVDVGAELTISMETRPSLRGVKTAIGGGPVLVSESKSLRFRDDDADSYESSSMTERHPRSAIGWNEDWFFLVEVDGRQRGSVGMTLSELGAYLAQLGCQGAMNLDGGGSATLWFNGAVQNRPCDGQERPVANALIVTRLKPESGGGSSPARTGGALPQP